MYRTGNYRVLEVGEDDVRMSKFIETKLNGQYEDGKAFYEVTENDPEEDLLYCKKILRPQTNEVFSYNVYMHSDVTIVTMIIYACYCTINNYLHYAAQSRGITNGVTH